MLSGVEPKVPVGHPFTQISRVQGACAEFRDESPGKVFVDDDRQRHEARRTVECASVRRRA
jgi:hypothetical protein